MTYEIFYLVGASKENELENIKSEVEKIVKDAGGEFLEKETLEDDDLRSVFATLKVAKNAA